MNKINIDMINCYGINRLNYEFDFTEDNVYTIYARNGLMKTSFAKTMKKIQDNKVNEVRDEVFNIQGEVKLECDDSGNNLKPDDIFVIKSYENSYESSSISSLLVNERLNGKIKTMLKTKDKFLKKIEKMSGVKIERTLQGKKIYELEPTIIKDFNFSEKSILLNINKFNVKDIEDEFKEIKYTSIFDESVLKKIVSDEFQNKIEEFISKSDEICSEFSFLHKGKYTLSQLKNTEKTLTNENFFVRSNKVILDGSIEINNSKELKEKITNIENKLKESPQLKDIQKMLSDVKGTTLKLIIENNPYILPYLKLDKLEILKQNLWLSRIKSEKELFTELKTQYEELVGEIEKEKFDETPWQEALNIFKERFTVPYEMVISNLKSSIIGESVPRIEFKFKKDDETDKFLNRNDLESIDILSQGEKRALYLLNVIFDIEKRKKENKETLFIIDDIADSFDYKNKYAIVEYLCDIADIDNFYMIILSHNFDFYRTVSNRLGVKKEHKLLVKKNEENITLYINKGEDKPFKKWKENLSKKNIIALIPFVRNLIEYGKDENVVKLEGIPSDKKILTSLLHVTENNRRITLDILKKIYMHYLGSDKFSEEIETSELVSKCIVEVANDIDETDIDLENKIVLVIAIRLVSEEYMLKKIEKFQGRIKWIERGKRGKTNEKYDTSSNFLVHALRSPNQTRALFNGYKQFGHKEAIKVLEKVNIMTPENIHLNSFMYEPILDMDIVELLNLYKLIVEFNKEEIEELVAID